MLHQYIISFLIAAAVGYLLGSCNGAIISVRLIKNKDIRQFGSHNAGLTNTLRCFGKVCGALTLLIDVGKGAAAAALAQQIGRWMNWAPIAEGTGSEHDFRWLCYVAGFFAILGHVFPLYYKFRGGKGVLVGVSVFLIINPLVFLILMAIFGLILWRSKYVSLSSCIATVCAVPATLIMEAAVRGATELCIAYTVAAACMAFPIVWKHKENIQRLKEGTERRIGQPKPDQS